MHVKSIIWNTTTGEDVIDFSENARPFSKEETTNNQVAKRSSKRGFTAHVREKHYRALPLLIKKSSEYVFKSQSEVVIDFHNENSRDLLENGDIIVVDRVFQQVNSRNVVKESDKLVVEENQYDSSKSCEERSYYDYNTLLDHIRSKKHSSNFPRRFVGSHLYTLRTPSTNQILYSDESSRSLLNPGEEILVDDHSNISGK
ncbi:hypothetical protein BDC45DRAFT_532929 [Circinella umbellata]|nr:hypothetical protein BDC45DRAFT_532929 [Circinella umbellata]